jgi:cytochrome c-type biogenesis protein CcmH/NrfG
MLVITPSQKDHWYQLGEIAVGLGDWKNAEFAYQKYIAFSRDKIKGWQNIALLHFVSGDFLSKALI